ncbi:MAG: rhodanese-like domain-containing protein [Acidobacteriaceae bacterium]|nr:rhodanese-like domain-containing protein [Acidobacteriaceae bacterium]
MHLLDAITRHGYTAIAAFFFLASCGLPLPLALIGMTAGAAAHGGSLWLPLVLLCSTAASVLGDTITFLGGRFTGWWLLAGICRLSLNPETCVFGSAHSFYRRGPRTLLFAKFIPGLATVAAPLAGSLNMRLLRFLRFNATGALLYAATWSIAGYLVAPVLRTAILWVASIGNIAGGTLLLVIAAYFLYMVVHWVRDTRFSRIDNIAAADLHRRMQEYQDQDRVVVIADVRSHGYYDPKAQRIKNSIRVEPNRIREELSALREFMAPECDVYLYCSCARDATSLRVARLLAEENCHTHVIRGGLKAWIKAGGPLEPVPATDVEHLPRFDE